MKGIVERVWSRQLPLYVMGGGTYARKIPLRSPLDLGCPGRLKRQTAGRAAAASRTRA